MFDRLIQHYPVLHELAMDDVQAALRNEAQLVEVPAGAVLFEEGAPCKGFPMVLQGGVRVARGSPGGRTLELYRVTPGELCVVSTSCLFGQVALTAHGQTVAPTELVLLSPAGFARWVQHEPFRRYVFGIFADRLADLMALAEAVAFSAWTNAWRRRCWAAAPRCVAPIRPWPTSWVRCARSSPACSAALNARAG